VKNRRLQGVVGLYNMLFWCYRINNLIWSGLLGGCEGMRGEGVKHGGGSEQGADASLSCKGDIINSLTFRFSDIIGCC